MHELDSAREIVLHCHHGVRSLRALETLRAAGFRRLRNLRGGIDAYINATSEQMTGTIRVRLFKGAAQVVGRTTKHV